MACYDRHRQGAPHLCGGEPGIPAASIGTARCGWWRSGKPGTASIPAGAMITSNSSSRLQAFTQFPRRAPREDGRLPACFSGRYFIGGCGHDFSCSPGGTFRQATARPDRDRLRPAALRLILPRSASAGRGNMMREAGPYFPRFNSGVILFTRCLETQRLFSAWDTRPRESEHRGTPLRR